MIDQRIMDNHTNFIGKIVGININTATIQPLIMYKVYGEKAQRTAVLTDVPILCPYKYVYKVDKATQEVTISQSELKIEILFIVVCVKGTLQRQEMAIWLYRIQVGITV